MKFSSANISAIRLGLVDDKICKYRVLPAFTFERYAVTAMENIWVITGDDDTAGASTRCYRPYHV